MKFGIIPLIHKKIIAVCSRDDGHFDDFNKKMVVYWCTEAHCKFMGYTYLTKHMLCRYTFAETYSNRRLSD